MMRAVPPENEETVAWNIKCASLSRVATNQFLFLFVLRELMEFWEVTQSIGHMPI